MRAIEPRRNVMAQAVQPVAPVADSKHNVAGARQAYYDRISKFNMAPLWERLRQLVGNEPKTQCAPAIWRFKDVKAMVMESADLISAKEAERRVLVLENPALRGQSRITQSLYAGLQLIMPGEVAPAHRHTASAIRFILDGAGAYTAVEGERTMMSPGDFVLTPNWAYHDHGNTSDRPMIWLDVLDLPTINFYETMFSEHLDEETQPVGHADGDSLAFFGSGVLPDGASVAPGRSPVINYTYARTRPILERLAKAGRSADRRVGDADHGRATLPAARRLQGRGLPRHRRHHLRVRRRGGRDHHRRPGVRLERRRRVRRPALAALRPRRRKRIGAVLDLRPPGPGGARHLARDQLRARPL
jgi:gentisate 1,2-dioxygenase